MEPQTERQKQAANLGSLLARGMLSGARMGGRAAAGAARFGGRTARNAMTGAGVGAAVGGKVLGTLGAAAGAPLGALGGAIATPLASLVRRTNVNPGVTNRIAGAMRQYASQAPLNHRVGGHLGLLGAPAAATGIAGSNAIYERARDMDRQSRTMRPGAFYGTNFR